MCMHASMFVCDCLTEFGGFFFPYKDEFLKYKEYSGWKNKNST